MATHASISTDSINFVLDSSLSIRPITFLYHSLFGLNQNTAYLNKDQDSRIFISSPSYVYCNRINRPILLFPGDSIKLVMGDYGGTNFITNNNERKQQLDLIEIWTDKIDSLLSGLNSILYDNPISSEVDALSRDSLLLAELFSREKAADSIFQSFKNSEQFLPEFERTLRNFQWSEFIRNRLNYFWFTKKYSQLPSIYAKRYPGIVDFFNQLNSKTDMTFYYDDLKELARQIVAYKTQTSGVYDLASFEINIKEINQVFKGLARDFLLADVIYTAFRNKIISKAEVLIYAKKECQFKIYRFSLAKLAKSYSSAELYVDSKKGSFILPFSTNKNFNEHELLETYKGKLILVDFWASWCVPCRKEMPLMRELKRQYLGKEIAFITISIDKNQSAWKKASQTEQIPEGNSFLANNNDSVFVFNNRKIYTIPRYFLFNKDGSLIDDNAPSPGSNELINLIDKYLENLNK